MRLHAVLLSLVSLTGAAGCATKPPALPPGLPPTPASITRANPGGDAADPEEAALARLAAESWGFRRDRFNTLRIPLTDWKHWQRVRLWNHPTRTAFRYGDDHYAVIGVWYTPIEGDNDPDTCIAKFLSENTPVAEAYGARVGKVKVVHTEQDVDGEMRPMTIRVIDGSVESLFESNDYVGALAAYQSWPGTCLLHGFAVVATEHHELAVKIRDRWVAEGAVRLLWEKRITEAPPTLAR